MRVVLVVVVLAAICVSFNSSALLDESEERQLNFYRAQVRITSEILISEECPSFTAQKQEDIQNTTSQIDKLKSLSDQLLQILVECRRKRNNIGETTAKPTTPTIVSSTKVATTKPQPTECQNAVNYTESWRRDHLGTNVRPIGLHSQRGYACDLGVSSNFWFRFTGEAGNQMLNKCPRIRSCGAFKPLWTDEKMPDAIGVETDVKVYGVGRLKCKQLTLVVKAMRCSWNTDYDIIFKQTTNVKRNCYYSFCGSM